MTDVIAQASFNSGEWSPTLFARVDIAKYRSGAALLENFFVDYRGGASTRPGSAYVIQAYKSSTPVRLIRFQVAFNVGYVLEFGDGYIRFIFHGAPVLENSFAITGASKANPCVLQVTGNNFVIGDWIFVTSVGGMTQLNGRYFSVTNVVGNAITIADLNGAPIDSTGYSTYTSGGTAARIYTIASPYAAADLALIKFSQSVNQMILCHPSYVTQVLTIISATNWTLLPATFGTTAAAPTAVGASTTLPAAAPANPSVTYGYQVTAVDVNGQESEPSAAYYFSGYQDMRVTAGTNQIGWTASVNALYYKVYKFDTSYFSAIPAGSVPGYIGFAYNTAFVDTNITPDYSLTPPISQNPFVGSGVQSVVATAGGAYTSVPTVTATGGSPTVAASLAAVLGVQGTPTIGSGGSGFNIGDTVQFSNGVVLVVATLSGSAVATWAAMGAPFTNRGSIAGGSTPSNPVAMLSTSGGGSGATATLTWGVQQVLVLSSGSGYVSTPTVVFSSGAASATATLGATSNGNPAVPGFFQQRLFLGGATGSPGSFELSKPGQYFNFDISRPSQPDDSISGTLVSGDLESIKALVGSTSGALILTDQRSWLINGGSNGSAISPSAIVANAQSAIGANDVPPIVANYDVLYVRSKGSGVQDLAFNIYFNVFTGTDISVLSSHLFYGFEVVEWAWAEQPFFVVWAVRNDGTLLSLTFLKEQDFIGWAHHVSPGSSYKSVATCTEVTTDAGTVDAVYTVVFRNINGHAVRYIERFAERVFPSGVADAWCVDSGIQYVGAPQTSFEGAEHLAGQTVTGLADGVVISPFIMPVSGQFTLATPASKVVIGLGFQCNLQTLPLDIGEPSIQGKVKKIPSVDIRVADTLGLKIGASFSSLVQMKDLVVGNVSSTLTGQPSQIITGLVTGDAMTILDNTYTVPGQYCLQQNDPLPATVLGVFPRIVVGDSK